MRKTIFSGIQPSGSLHIGNYVGAISQWVGIQNSDFRMMNSELGQASKNEKQILNQVQDDKQDKVKQKTELFYCIVDLHAITVPQDPKILRAKSREIAAIYVAAGIDPAKSHIFIQSENPDHPYLAWILNCLTPFGQLERMTQFKDKSLKQKESTTAGLFDYPVLMAADILLYDTDEVPVGEDQKQHIELARDLAEKFNSKYGETFKLPEPKISRDTGRIMSLQDPSSKMSKSDDNSNGAIFLLDSPDAVRQKIKRAVTDSGDRIEYTRERPAIYNLLNIYSVVSGESVEALVKKHSNDGYGVFKEDLATAVVEFLTPFQEKYRELTENSDVLDKILDAGAEYARSISSKKISEVKGAVGLRRQNGKR